MWRITMPMQKNITKLFYRALYADEKTELFAIFYYYLVRLEGGSSLNDLNMGVHF